MPGFGVFSASWVDQLRLAVKRWMRVQASSSNFSDVA
jgi:hypothetical protein